MRLNQPRLIYVPTLHSKTLSEREKELQAICKGNWEMLRKTIKLSIPFRCPFWFDHWNGIFRCQSIPTFCFGFTDISYIG